MSCRREVFETLEWTWHMLRRYRDDPDGINKARRFIKETLAKIAAGDEVNFTVDIKATFKDLIEPKTYGKTEAKQAKPTHVSPRPETPKPEKNDALEALEDLEAEDQ